MKVVIVGAGIAGLAIGWRLAQRGTAVEILERGLAGQGATWASAGMIAPGAELEDTPDALAQFALRSRAAWPNFASELEAESGCVVGYDELGSLIVAFDESQAHALKQRSAERNPGEWVPPGSLRRREPLLSSALCGALFIKGDAQVDSRLVGDALRAALLQRNVIVRENTPARGLLVEQERVRGVICASDTVAADVVVVASGAWLSTLATGVRHALPPIAPVKGQMIAVELPAGGAAPRHLLWGEHVYLVPRGNRILVGATIEDAGFDISVAGDACRRLVAAAARIVPALPEWRIAEMWAGLRPKAPDGAPVLGATPVAGLYVAGGQFRNGILFAPAVADAMAEFVLAGHAGPEIGAFDPRRFMAR